MKKKMKKIFYIIAIIILASCTPSANVPTAFTESEAAYEIYPDYKNVTVPVNIAPLNFAIEVEADDYVTRLKSGSTEVVIGGQSVQIAPTDWEALKAADSKHITVEVFTQKGGKWTRHTPFLINVVQDKIDPYISYRLISPSYVTYENLTLNQRNLETFDETLIYSNMINTDEENGQCINCHTSQNANPNRTHFHVRQALGGTVINYDGDIKKIDMKVDGVISAGVYPAWHPKEDLIAYSTNMTGQTFHTYDPQKIEVQDTYSDLTLYDIKKNEIIALECDTNDLDCFPAWDNEGKYLYYCSAHYEKIDSSEAKSKEMDLIENYEKVHYNLYRRSFDAKSRQFGPREMVYDCADTCSATLPRISPDGKYLLFTRGNFGVFHIWHSSADLYLMNLTTRQTRCATELNSPEVESYHTWSTNGKWIVFSSRRHDGNFTRPFFAYFKADGTFTKPFELPQQDPRYHQEFLRSYNVPEFLTGPVSVTPHQLADAIAGESSKATRSPLSAQPNIITDATTGASAQAPKQ